VILIVYITVCHPMCVPVVVFAMIHYGTVMTYCMQLLAAHNICLVSLLIHLSMLSFYLHSCTELVKHVRLTFS